MSIAVKCGLPCCCDMLVPLNNDDMMMSVGSGRFSINKGRCLLYQRYTECQHVVMHDSRDIQLDTL